MVQTIRSDPFSVVSHSLFEFRNAYRSSADGETGSRAGGFELGFNGGQDLRPVSGSHRAGAISFYAEYQGRLHALQRGLSQRVAHQV
jgi:hypothetical protein